MSSISRRSVAKGAAWAAPAVLASNAIPAYAASTKTTISGNICSLFYGTGTASAQTHRITFGIDSSSPIIPAGTTITWTITMAKGTATISDYRKVPTTNYSPNNLWSLTVSPSTGTQTGSFSVTFKANTDVNLADVQCALQVMWDSSQMDLSGGTQITVSSISSGTAVNSTTSSLAYTVARRHSTSTAANTAHIYISKSGTQTCYPAVQYSFFSPSVAAYGTNGSSCAASWGNNSSTIYPDGTCSKVNITSGQATVAQKC